MKVWAIGVGVLILILITAVLVALPKEKEEITGEPIKIVAKPCKADLGESCEKCECLAPAKCVKGTCILGGQEDGSACAYNQQCKSGQCVDNMCSYGEKLVATCKYECRDDNYGRRTCSTICRE